MSIFAQSGVHGSPAAVLGSSAVHEGSAGLCRPRPPGVRPKGRAGQAHGCVFAGDFLCRRCLGGVRCRLDADQMALGADEPLAGALQLRELPLPSPALRAAGSGGRGINLLLPLPRAGGG